MTAVNDGLPLDESAAYDVDETEAELPPPAAGHVPDPPTEQLPLTPVADPPTQVLPAQAGSTTDGSVAGDLFDGTADR